MRIATQRALGGLLALVLGLAAPASAREEWTVDDVIGGESVEEIAVAPDGTAAVWVLRKMSREKGEAISNLVLTRFAPHEEIPLTRGTDRNRRPLWSPDGTRIAFLSDRPLPETPGEGGDGTETAKTQIWLLRTAGGEPWPLTRLARDVRDFRWRDAGSILFLAAEDPAESERQRKKEKDTTEVVEDEAHEPPVRVFLVDVESGERRRVTTNTDWIRAFDVSPDGRWIATIHQRSLRFAFDHEIPPVVRVTDVATGESRPVAADRRILPRSVAWAADGSGFYFTTEFSSHPRYFTATVTRLHFYEVATDRVLDVDLGWEKGLGGPLAVTGDGFLALLADGVRYRPARYRRAGDGWEKIELTGPNVENLFDWALSPDGTTLVYESSSASRPPQWYRTRLEGAALAGADVFTDLNASWKSKRIPRAEVVRWTGARGDTVEGILHYPLDYREGERYPLVLMIHGGPTGVDMDRWPLGWSRPITPLSERGAFVFRPNYHGSGNYGLEWAESICCGKYYELERVDLEAGVDALIERGLVDPDRLAVMGWSNGAILTTELVTRTDRYKAAAAGAGDVEWISDWANVDFGASFDNYYFGAPPYENPQLYIEKSPYFRLKNVTTPTLIATGTEDRNVPPSQSWSHYRVLQQATATPVRLLLFPGEPHGLRKYAHQKRKVAEELAWLDRYLFGTEAKRPEALRTGSPLDRRLRLARVARVGALYGVERDGTLVPEIVAYEGLEVGRFEVTRAQYRAFDPSYPVPPGTENHPASGLDEEAARRYVAWLSERTGESYRLARGEETARLYGAAKGEENTLDYWAGYAPNPEDAAALRELARGLEGEAPLLLPVGSFAGRGEDEPVFDLGGNVAEWCEDDTGRARLCGGSADRPAARENRGEPGPAYRGVRVVRDGRRAAVR